MHSCLPRVLRPTFLFVISLLALALSAGTALATTDRAGAVPAAEAQLDFPIGIALGPDGSIYVSERGSHKVRRLDPANGMVTTVAGTGDGGYSGDGGPAHQAMLGCPDSLDADPEGNLYIADRCNHRIRRVDAKTGIITTVAGNGERDVSPDGPALESPLMGAFFVRAESAKVLLMTDTDSHRIRRVDLDRGWITTIAGSGERGYGGDGGPALQAQLNRPHIALYASNGDLVVGDSFNQRIRRVDQASGTIRAIAGRMERGVAEDGSPALEAPFGYFGGIEELANGDLLITEWSNGRLLRLEQQSGRIQVLAGTTEESASPADDQPLRKIKFGSLADIAIDSQGRLAVVNTSLGLVRTIDLKRGVVKTVIGPPPGKE